MVMSPRWIQQSIENLSSRQRAKKFGSMDRSVGYQVRRQSISYPYPWAASCMVQGSNEL